MRRLWESFEAAQKLVTIENVTQPRKEAGALYDKMYQAFLNAYGHLVPTFDELAECRVMIEKFSKEGF